jgi:hypothetical protein
LAVLGPWCLGLGLLAAVLLLAALGEARGDDRAGVAVAEDLSAMEQADKTGGSGRWGGLRVETGGSCTAPATVSGATVSAWQEEGKIAYDTGAIALDLGGATGQYDFSRAGRLPFGGRAPFENLTRFDAGLTLKGGLWRDVAGFLGLRGDLGYEQQPDARGLGGTALAGVIVPLGSQWSATLGGGVSLTPVEVQAVPMVGLRYESASVPGFTANLGLPRTEVAWRGGSWWTLRATGAIESGHYRLCSDNPAAPDGTVALFAARLGAWVDLEPARGLRLGLGALYTLPGTMTFYRESGSRLKTYAVGGAPGGALRFDYSF